MRRRFLFLGLLAVALAAVAAACGGGGGGTTPATAPPATSETAPPSSGPAETGGTETGGAGQPDQYGETYNADPAVLTQALFDPAALPEDPAAKQVALAAFSRVNMNLDPATQQKALECWKNNGCDTGTGGDITAAYLEPFGENVYREVSKMEFILQALTYPEIGKIIYTSSHAFTSTPSDPLADFRAAIAQGADVIVSYPDIGDGYLPVYKEATQKGIPVSTYAWGYVSGPGQNYLSVTGEDTCALGKAYADILNKEVGSGEVALLGGTNGNPLSLGWMKCEREALNPNIKVVGPFWTNWVASQVQQVMSSLLASHPNLKGLSYEYAGGMALGGLPAYKAAGVTPSGVWTLRTDEADLGCALQKLNAPNLKVYYYTGGNWQIRTALTADMMKLKGFDVPPEIVFPIRMQEMSQRTTCVPGYPGEGSATSLVPVDLLKQMYPQG
jgi:ribose transport system substrate-binding protein